jgi:hypothetical protein
VAIPSTIHHAGQGKVHDPDTILLKFLAEASLIILNSYDIRGAAEIAVVRAAGLGHLPSKGGQAATTWRFWLRDITRFEELPLKKGSPMTWRSACFRMATQCRRQAGQQWLLQRP